MLGLNQVVMQTLAMVVIASLVGASGLGQKLLFSLQQLQIGKAVEQGVAITLIAIVLDRLTQSYMRTPARAWPQRRTLAGTASTFDALPRSDSAVRPGLARVSGSGRPAEGNDFLVRRPHQRCGPVGVKELVCLHKAGTRLDHHLAAAANARLLSLAALAGCHRRARRDRISLRRPAARLPAGCAAGLHAPDGLLDAADADDLSGHERHGALRDHWNPAGYLGLT